MASQVVIKPSFLLKGIDPYALIEEYNSGQVLASLSLEKKKITSVNLTNNRGKSFRDSIYTFRNRDNFMHTVATSGAKNFKFVDEKKEPRKGGVCFVCRQEFTHSSLGIPISIRKEGDTILVFTLGTTCDFPCTLRLIRNLYRQTRRVSLENAEQFLRYLYRKMYPEAPHLQEAPDPFLLVQNDGCLTQEEYKDPRYIYVPVPNLIVYPAKEQYLRLVNTQSTYHDM